MTIDCTLDNLKIPALPTYENEFGTKKKNGGLTTAECTDDAMLPFRKMRPYEINEDTETTEIQHNAVFVAKAENITLTLHDCSDSFLGCEARVINVSSGNITVKGGVSGIDGGTAGITVPAKREIRLIFLSDGWHSSYDDFCNITEKEIANSAVTTDKIKDKSVMNSKIGETLTIANGGTGATTANQSINNLAVGLEEATGDGSDTMGFITTDANTIDLNADDKKIYKRSGLRVWNWIEDKIKTVLGLDKNSLTTDTITASGTVTAPNFKGKLIGNADTATKATSADTAKLASSAEAVAWGNIINKPDTYAPSGHTHKKADITDFPTSMPASDVSAWAKAKLKPSYSWSEITDQPAYITGSYSDGILDLYTN